MNLQMEKQTNENKNEFLFLFFTFISLIMLKKSCSTGTNRLFINSLANCDFHLFKRGYCFLASISAFLLSLSLFVSWARIHFVRKVIVELFAWDENEMTFMWRCWMIAIILNCKCEDVDAKTGQQLELIYTNDFIASNYVFSSYFFFFALTLWCA